MVFGLFSGSLGSSLLLFSVYLSISFSLLLYSVNMDLSQVSLFDFSTLDWPFWLRFPKSLDYAKAIGRLVLSFLKDLVTSVSFERELIVEAVGITFLLYLFYYFFFFSRCPTLLFQDTEFNRNVAKDAPSLNKRYWPTFWLPTGNIQSLFTAFYTSCRPVDYRREIIAVTAKAPYLPGEISLDWALFNQEYTDDSPILVIFHGLSGGSRDRYVKQMILEANKSLPNMRVVVFIARGCAGTELVSAQAYCAGYTDDGRQAIEHIARLYPNAKLFAVGYSLGANVLTKLLGEDGNRSKLTAAVSIGNPYDVYHGSYVMHDSWFRRIFCSIPLTVNLKYMTIRFMKIYAQTKYYSNLAKVNEIHNLRDYDRIITAPLFGFSTVNQYYRESSSCRYIINIKRPLLCLSATDDTICDKAVIPYDECFENPNVILATTKSGGHSMDFHSGFFVLRSWSAEVVCDYLSSILKHLPENALPTDENKLFHPLSGYMAPETSVASELELKDMIKEAKELSLRLDKIQNVVNSYSTEDSNSIRSILQEHDESQRALMESSQQQLDQLVMLTSQLNTILDN